MVGTISGGVSGQVQAAENDKKTVKINQAIEVARESFEIAAIVTYDGLKDIGSNESISREEWVVALSETLGKEAVTDTHYSFDDFEEASNPEMIEAAIRAGVVPVQADSDNMVFNIEDSADNIKKDPENQEEIIESENSDTKTEIPEQSAENPDIISEISEESTEDSENKKSVDGKKETNALSETSGIEKSLADEVNSEKLE